MIDLLSANPLLLLFLIAAIGHPLGRLTVKGFSLGIAAVLFTGLAFGALSPDLKTPALLSEFGLVVFVYAVGVSSGPAFFGAMKRGGLRDNATVLGAIGLAAVLVYAAASALRLKGTYAAGLLAGALTNTPALAGAVERLKASAVSEAVQAEPVVAYSIAYPMGVIAMLVAITVLKKRWAIPDAQPPEPVSHRSVLVRDPRPLLALPEGLRIGRHLHGATERLSTLDAPVVAGDTVSLIGPERLLNEVIPSIGDDLGEALELSREHLDMRRIFVSDQRVAGARIGDLRLPATYGATVTRVRRGDVDHLADDRTVLELGDRVRVVAPREAMGLITTLFGDSYHRLSEIDAMTFSAGIALGLGLGLVPVPLGGGQTFHLGLAGGPLVVGLILGAVGRTGPLHWQLPYGASLTLRQIGLILFLAGVGSRSGDAFFRAVATPLGLSLFVAGTVVTAAVAVAFLWFTHKVQRVPFAQAVGLLAGLQTQPAVLAFAAETMKSEEPNLRYATVYPVATIAKLILVQLLLG